MQFSPSSKKSTALGLMAALVTLLSLAASPVFALELPPPSPSAKVFQQVGLTKISVKYNSPAVRGREIWGKLVAYDANWRTGANDPTLIKFSNDVVFGQTKVKAGKYSLFSKPSKAGWMVFLNSNLATWGGRNYDPKQNVAEIKVTSQASVHRERLTFFFANTTDTQTQLVLEWEKLSLTIDIQVDTKAHATAAIDKTLGSAWRPFFLAGRYLLDSKGDLAQAHKHLDASLQIKATWWAHWWKALVFEAQGKTLDALRHGQEADKLGATDRIYTEFFKAVAQKKLAAWSSKK